MYVVEKIGLDAIFSEYACNCLSKFFRFSSRVVRNNNALRLFFTLVLLVVIFRELAVTSLRLVASTSAGAVVAANMLGKIKTVMQIVFISTVFIEPALYAIPFVGNLLPAWWVENVPLSYLTGGLTLLFTVWSGINYFIGMWKYLDPEK